MENEIAKRILDAETERKLREVLPFEPDESAEVTLDCFSNLPEEVRPYFQLRPLSFEQRQSVLKGNLSIDGITGILKGGVLVGWTNYQTRRRKNIPFSLEEIDNMSEGWRSALFMQAFGFDSPSAVEREGLESSPPLA